MNISAIKDRVLGMNPLQCAVHLWCIAFFLITFDKVLVLEIKGMTIKSSYFFFMASGLFLMRHTGIYGILRYIGSVFKFLPWLLLVTYIVFLSFHSIIFSVYRFKSIAYTLWLFFDAIAIVFPLLVFRLEELKIGTDRSGQYPYFLGTFVFYIALAITFLSFVTIIDYSAFFFGKPYGLLGFSQTDLFYYNWPRPHAYSFEPSYISMFFALGLVVLIVEFVKERPLFSSRGKRLLIPILMGGIAMIMFFSRSGLAFFGLMVIGAYFVFLRMKIISIRQASMHALAVLILIIGFFVVLPDSEYQKLKGKMVTGLVGGVDGSARARLYGVIAATELAKSKNGMGVGIGNSYFYERIREKKDHLDAKDFGKQHIQNLWFEILAEQGFVSLFLFLSFVLTLWWKLYKSKVEPLILAQRNVAIVAVVLFFAFEAHFFPNISRSDMWVWIAYWGYLLKPNQMS